MNHAQDLCGLCCCLQKVSAEGGVLVGHQLIFQIEDFCLTNVLQNLGQKISLWSCHSLTPKLWCSKSVSYKILSSLGLKPSTAKKSGFETCDISSSATLSLMPLMTLSQVVPVTSCVNAEVPCTYSVHTLSCTVSEEHRALWW